ncbi:MAG: hypothetical protein FJ225_06840 [Lentisphaerae bacterium]|nr:hypothetical protein [Lentisphaerota bacterium]
MTPHVQTAGHAPRRAAGIILPACAALAFAAPGRAQADTLVQRLIARYASLESVACSVRKTTSAGDATVRLLSRVAYRRPNLLNVAIVAPTERRIVCDGERLYYHEKGGLRGFSRPVAELSPEWAAALRNIPATPMENLIRLQDCPERALPPTAEFPLRRAYAASNVHVVVSCDTNERPARLEFFKTAELRESTGRYDYGDFVRAGGCWLAREHKAVVFMPDGSEIRETRRVDNLKVNAPVDETLFDSGRFFHGVVFTNDFAMTYTDAPPARPDAD